MNILEPLYYDCIQCMRGCEKKDTVKEIKMALAEISEHYRSNDHYFIFKSIILRNLYGVDIMAEATEIAKLRLFLKMVSVVDVNLKADNLGLDPLPDIDFNIRCGNTLVGYANEAELLKASQSGFFSQEKYEEEIKVEMEKTDRAYKKFRKIQLSQDNENKALFKEAKDNLTGTLAKLNDELNHYLYEQTGDHRLGYDRWLKSHQPFHWLTEFYQIIQGNGGFDVIIGNPPYVEYNRKNKATGKSVADIYRLKDYVTFDCGNLYAYVVERSCNLSSGRDKIGFIVPLSLASNNNMGLLRDFLSASGNAWYSHFEVRPAKLFEGAEQRLTIFLLRNSSTTKVYSTPILRWHNEDRELLFKTISYSPSFYNGTIWRTSSILECAIYSKFILHKLTSSYLCEDGSGLQYRTAGVRYWIIFLNQGFGTQSLSNKCAFFEDDAHALFFMAAFNSNLFWWYYALNFDMFNLKDYMIFGYRLNYK